MIRFPTSLSQTKGPGEGPAPVVRAGGTDLTERRRHRLVEGPLVDLRDLPGLDKVEWNATGGGARLGAKLTVAAVADDESVRWAYPGLCAAAGDLATPQIRAVATLGGNLLQANRCWYFRNPAKRCLKKGGSMCLARAGDHLYHSCIDLGPCAAVHPSTLGMALLAYEALVEVHGMPSRTVQALYGDGSDATVDHQLEPGAILTHVQMPVPVDREQAAYFRTTSRARSEWPLVECLARLVVSDGAVSFARVAVGGVAARPLRLPAVEAALVGERLGPQTLEAAAKVAREGASPLPMTDYKVDLLEGTVLETLERASHATPSTLAGAVRAAEERAAGAVGGEQAEADTPTKKEGA